MKKRILPALLALCMVMSLLPVAFAVDCTGADGCTADTHNAGCPAKCTCTKITGKVEGKNCAHDAGAYTNSKADGETVCATCKANSEAAAASTPDPAPGGDTTPCDAEGCTLENGHEGKHNNTVCIKAANCGATTHSTGCAEKCSCAVEAVHGVGASCTNSKTGDSEDAKEGAYCATCLANDACDPCDFGNCTKKIGHEGAHNNTTCPGTADTDHACAAETHTGSCSQKCTLAVQGYNPDGTENGGATATGCTLTKGHEGNHNNTVCIKTDKCGATGNHVKPVEAVEADPENGVEAVPAVVGCPNYVPGTCGKGGCTLQAKHPGNHNNTKCLGYNDDGKCGVAGDAEHPHIAGCSKYSCGCSHEHTNFTTTLECTSKPGCAFCNEWNAFVTKQNAKVAAYTKYTEWQAKKTAYDEAIEADPDQTEVANPGDWVGTVPSDPGAAATACTCKDCKPNPAMGAVVDAEGNVVDPAEPTETPTKAEDFKDADKMDDWMKDAVQVMLDKGWMEGTTEGNFDPREDANTNVVLTVIARMSGETITGATWADDAKAWAEENELTEGIEITKSDIARKDIVLMLWRLAGKKDSEQALDDFTDVDGLEGDYLTAMKWAVENKIVLGNGDGTVTPDGTLKRAELAALVARYAALEK